MDVRVKSSKTAYFMASAAFLWSASFLTSQPVLPDTRDSVAQHTPVRSVEDIIDRAVMRRSAVLSRGLEYLYDLHARTVNRFAQWPDRVTMVCVYHGTRLYARKTYSEKYCGFRQAGDDGIFWSPYVVDINVQDHIRVGGRPIAAPLSRQSRDHYRYTLQGTVTLNDYPVYDVAVEPKRKDRPLVRGNIYLSAEDFSIAGYDVTVSGVHHLHPQLHALKIHQEYQLFHSGLWLPAYYRAEAQILEQPFKGMGTSHVLNRKTSVNEIVLTDHLVRFQVDREDFNDRFAALLQAVEPFTPKKCAPWFEFDAHEIKALQTLPTTVKDMKDLKREFFRR